MLGIYTIFEDEEIKKEKSCLEESHLLKFGTANWEELRMRLSDIFNKFSRKSKKITDDDFLVDVDLIDDGKEETAINIEFKEVSKEELKRLKDKAEPEVPDNSIIFDKQVNAYLQKSHKPDTKMREKMQADLELLNTLYKKENWPDFKKQISELKNKKTGKDNKRLLKDLKEKKAAFERLGSCLAYLDNLEKINYEPDLYKLYWNLALAMENAAFFFDKKDERGRSLWDKSWGYYNFALNAESELCHFVKSLNSQSLEIWYSMAQHCEKRADFAPVNAHLKDQFLENAIYGYIHCLVEDALCGQNSYYVEEATKRSGEIVKQLKINQDQLEQILEKIISLARYKNNLSSNDLAELKQTCRELAIW